MVGRLVLFLLWMAMGIAAAHAQKGQFLSSDAFYRLAFPANETTWKTLWVTPEIRQQAEQILARQVKVLRIRYQGEGSTTAWIFEEIGKELPITVGVVVDAGQIVRLEVLEYRESRGGEVRYPFFTDQFKGTGLNDGKTLNRTIDGITGATLSVGALKRIAALALYCHQQTPFASASAVANEQ